MTTGRLFAANLPEMLPLGCWTPDDGTLLFTTFLFASDPGIFWKTIISMNVVQTRVMKTLN